MAHESDFRKQELGYVTIYALASIDSINVESWDALYADVLGAAFYTVKWACFTLEIGLACTENGVSSRDCLGRAFSHTTLCLHI